MTGIIRALYALHGRKRRIILMSSKTIKVNYQQLRLTRQPGALTVGRTITTINRKQLVQVCSSLFSTLGRPVTRILLAHDSLTRQSHCIGDCHAFHRLLRLKIVPVIGRGSAITIRRLGFNSGSALSTLITDLVKTSLLFLLASMSHLCSTSPHAGPRTRPVPAVSDLRTLRRLGTVTKNRKST